MRIERLCTLDIGEAERERVREPAVLHDARRATGLARLHESREDSLDRALGRRIRSRRHDRCQGHATGGERDGRAANPVSVTVRQKYHFDSDC
jgi:hypothetical protein